MKRFARITVYVIAMLSTAQYAFAHCQIPCGIYNDEMRFVMLREHITTIEKSMTQIIELSKDPGGNANQLIRWTINKENHADDLCQIVTYYFMQQRVKPVDRQKVKEHEVYVRKLTLCHEMMVVSMKAKQTTDLKHVEALKSLLAEFRKVYFGPEGEKHLGEHHK